MKHLKKWWPVYGGIFVICIIIFGYIWRTSENLLHFSTDRDDWKDLAEFISFLVSPVIAIAAVYIAWVTYISQQDASLLGNFEFQLKTVMTELDELEIAWNSGDTMESSNRYMKSLSLQTFLSKYNILYGKFRKRYKNEENWLTFLQTLNISRKRVFVFLNMHGFILANLQNLEPKPEEFSTNFKVPTNMYDFTRQEILKFLKSFDVIKF